MNKKMIIHIIGKMMGVEALLLLLPAFVGFLYGEESAVWFVVTAAVLAVFFLVALGTKPEDTKLYGKDGLFIVSSAWILWSLFGAMPFFLSGSIPNYVDAFFETVSGFTTTGSTILKDVEALPQCMLFWRSFTHWVGGMGVLVFVMVLTNLNKQNAIHLMRAEVPGPEKDKLVPKARDTARILYVMYFILTMVQVVLMMAGGMNLFDSLVHAFGTAGTGGFSNYADSVGHFDSAYQDGVITVFMILFGINFNLYYFLAIRQFKTALKNEELWGYLGIIAAAIAAITVNLSSSYDSVLGGVPLRGLPGGLHHHHDRIRHGGLQRVAGAVQVHPGSPDDRGRLRLLHRRRHQGVPSPDRPQEHLEGGQAHGPPEVCERGALKRKEAGRGYDPQRVHLPACLHLPGDRVRDPCICR